MNDMQEAIKYKDTIKQPVNVENITKFSNMMSKISGQYIGLDHIHPSDKGRYYYIQAPREGFPMLLHHYRGPFFIDLNPEDFNKIVSGEVDARDFIMQSNWLVGYYWGGGSMISGGYYQPFDLNNRDDLQRYLKILSCRGSKRSSGYQASEETCAECPVDNCPFSRFKDGSWNNERKEDDPRIHLFNALDRRFSKEYPKYELHGCLCGELPEREIRLRAMKHYSFEEEKSLEVFLPESLVQDLLMHMIVPEDWDEFAKEFKFTVDIFLKEDVYDLTPENIKMVFDKVNSED